MEAGKYFLVNLSPDPSLSELLVYYLKPTTRVGRSGEGMEIQLSGSGIQEHHCTLEIKESSLTLTPVHGARTCVNGAEVDSETILHHGDRILWGSGHFFRINCPTSAASLGNENSFDWRQAQEEVMMAEAAGNSGMDEIIARLEKKYSEEKQAALELQRQEYEQQLLGVMGEDEMDGEGENVRNWLAMGGSTAVGVGEEQFKASLGQLRAGLAKAGGQVREANLLAAELDLATTYNLTLQIPPALLSPSQPNSGKFLQEPSVLVSRQDVGRQVWALEHLAGRLGDMRDAVEEARAEGEKGFEKADPFYDSIESHNLIGVASIYLSCLLSDVGFEYSAPVLSQDGKVAGKLLVQLKRIAGSFPQDRVVQANGIAASSSSSTHTSVEESRMPITVRLQVKSVVGLPPALAHFVFCQYSFPGDADITVIPSLATGVRTVGREAADFTFEYTRDIIRGATEEFLEVCEEQAVAIEVYGHKERGSYTAKEARDQRRKEATLADRYFKGKALQYPSIIRRTHFPRYSIAHPDLCWVCFDLRLRCHHTQTRWSELVRRLELWLEVQELNDEGRYAAVNIEPETEVSARFKGLSFHSLFLGRGWGYYAAATGPGQTDCG